MPQVAKIQTTQVSLDELIKNSVTINALPEAEKRKVIARIKALPKSEQKKVAEVLLKEKTRAEEIQQEYSRDINQLTQKYSTEIKTYVRKKKKEIRVEQEGTDRQADEAQKEQILKEIEQA